MLVHARSLCPPGGCVLPIFREPVQFIGPVINALCHKMHHITFAPLYLPLHDHQPCTHDFATERRYQFWPNHNISNPSLIAERHKNHAGITRHLTYENDTRTCGAHTIFRRVDFGTAQNTFLAEKIAQERHQMRL